VSICALTIAFGNTNRRSAPGPSLGAPLSRSADTADPSFHRPGPPSLAHRRSIRSAQQALPHLPVVRGPLTSAGPSSRRPLVLRPTTKPGRNPADHVATTPSAPTGIGHHSEAVLLRDRRPAAGRARAPYEAPALVRSVRAGEDDRIPASRSSPSAPATSWPRCARMTTMREKRDELLLAHAELRPAYDAALKSTWTPIRCSSSGWSAPVAGRSGAHGLRRPATCPASDLARDAALLDSQRGPEDLSREDLPPRSRRLRHDRRPRPVRGPACAHPPRGHGLHAQGSSASISIETR
jgi:hypothetical protein